MNIQQILKDLNNGFTNMELMNKHNLNYEEEFAIAYLRFTTEE